MSERAHQFYDIVWAAAYAAAMERDAHRLCKKEMSREGTTMHDCIWSLDDAAAIAIADQAVKQLREVDSWSDEKRRAYLNAPYRQATPAPITERKAWARLVKAAVGNELRDEQAELAAAKQALRDLGVDVDSLLEQDQ